MIQFGKFFAESVHGIGEAMLRTGTEQVKEVAQDTVKVVKQMNEQG